jgi:hypothetical protein
MTSVADFVFYRSIIPRGIRWREGGARGLYGIPSHQAQAAEFEDLCGGLAEGLTDE